MCIVFSAPLHHNIFLRHWKVHKLVIAWAIHYYSISISFVVKVYKKLVTVSKGLSQLFYFFSTHYSIQNFPQNAPTIPKDCLIILINFEESVSVVLHNMMTQ